MKRSNQERLDLFYQDLIKTEETRRVQRQVASHYAYNRCGQSLLLIETIIIRVLQYLSIESLFKLCRVARLLGETLTSLVKRHPLTGIAFDSTHTFDQLRHYTQRCFVVPDLLGSLYKSVLHIRIRVRHDPFNTARYQRLALINGKARCDFRQGYTLTLEVVEQADIDEFFERFYVPDTHLTLFCLYDPDKYYGRSELAKHVRIPVPYRTITIISDFRGLQFATLKNMILNDA